MLRPKFVDQSDKLEALQKRAVCIIFYPLTLPYITALGYLKLEALKYRRTEADKKFFNSIYFMTYFDRLCLPYCLE